MRRLRGAISWDNSWDDSVQGASLLSSTSAGHHIFPLCSSSVPSSARLEQALLSSIPLPVFTRVGSLQPHKPGGDVRLESGSLNTWAVAAFLLLHPTPPAPAASFSSSSSSSPTRPLPPPLPPYCSPSSLSSPSFSLPFLLLLYAYWMVGPRQSRSYIPRQNFRLIKGGRPRQARWRRQEKIRGRRHPKFRGVRRGAQGVLGPGTLEPNLPNRAEIREEAPARRASVSRGVVARARPGASVSPSARRQPQTPAPVLRD